MAQVAIETQMVGSKAAFPAMMVFDVASDTILYCAMLDIIQKEPLSSNRMNIMPRACQRDFDGLAWL